MASEWPEQRVADALQRYGDALVSRAQERRTNIEAARRPLPRTLVAGGALVVLVLGIVGFAVVRGDDVATKVTTSAVAPPTTECADAACFKDALEKALAEAGLRGSVENTPSGFVVRRDGRGDITPVGSRRGIVGFVMTSDLDGDPVASFANCARVAGPEAPQCDDVRIAAGAYQGSRVWIASDLRGLPIFRIDGDPSTPIGYLTEAGPVAASIVSNTEALDVLRSCVADPLSTACSDPRLPWL